MKLYINKFGSMDSGEKFDTAEEFIAKLTTLVANAESKGEEIFEILWDAGKEE